MSQNDDRWSLSCMTQKFSFLFKPLEFSCSISWQYPITCSNLLTFAMLSPDRKRLPKTKVCSETFVPSCSIDLSENCDYCEHKIFLSFSFLCSCYDVWFLFVTANRLSVSQSFSLNRLSVTKFLYPWVYLKEKKGLPGCFGKERLKA